MTGESLAEIEIPCPSIKEQRQIISVLDRDTTKDQQEKTFAESVINQIDTMKKSILARAFRSELGTNDPTDEPAIELLQRALASS